MSLRGALATFDSDEKHSILILDKVCQEYVGDHYLKGVMKVSLLMSWCSMTGEAPASHGK
jgi:hypothetical protein